MTGHAKSFRTSRRSLLKGLGAAAVGISLTNTRRSAWAAEEPKLKPTYIEELEARLASKDAELQQILSKYRSASD